MTSFLSHYEKHFFKEYRDPEFSQERKEQRTP